MTRRPIVALALLLAAPALAEYGRAPDQGPPNTRPAVLERIGFDQRLGAQVPLDAPFRADDGRSVTFGQLLTGKPVLLVPAYATCPMLCPLVLNGTTSALRALAFDVGREFTVVTLSFDPHDTPERAAQKKAEQLASYRRPGAEQGWHFLTGDEAQIRRVTDAIGFRYAWDDASKQFAHASGIVVLTPDGRVSHYFYGVEFAPRDLRLALVEASDGRIGNVVDELLLFCFHYDPITGSYGQIALTAIRVGGALTLLALVALIVILGRRERTRRLRTA